MGIRLEMRGSANPASALTVDEVREIRELLRMKATLAGLAKRYDVSKRTISKIRDGETWGWVK